MWVLMILLKLIGIAIPVIIALNMSRSVKSAKEYGISQNWNEQEWQLYDKKRRQSFTIELILFGTAGLLAAFFFK
jgi:hypothetical protein